MAGPRLPTFVPQALTDEQRTVYRSVTHGPRSSGPQLFPLMDADGALDGPFNAFLLQPALGQALQELGAAVRYRSSLPDRAREVAILVVAAHWESAFEQYAHEAVAHHVGLTHEELQALRCRDYDLLSTPEDRLVARATDRLVRDGDLDDDAFDEAVAALGLPQLFELLTLIGYYATLALQLRVFRVGAPEEGKATCGW